MHRTTILLIICTLFYVSCKIPVGLEPVTGVEGKITFSGNWPEDIKAVTIIALDSLVLDKIGDYFVTYSSPIDSGAVESEYFIQLLPDQYYLAVVGITIKPSIFAVKIDSFLSAETIPIKLIDNDLQKLKTIINVKYQEVEIVNREIVF